MEVNIQLNLGERKIQLPSEIIGLYVIDMYFDYAGYVRECLNFPLWGFIMFNLLDVVLIIIYLFYMKHKKKTFPFPFPVKQLLILIVVLSSIDSACLFIGQLKHGGVYLLWEKEVDAIQIQGCITKIDPLNSYSLPIIECDYYENMKRGDPTGYEFTINGIQCTAPVKGSLEVGDYVSVTYLPKSGYILYIGEEVEQ